VTVGVLSAKEREIPIPDSSTGQTTIYKNLLQTDASINPGNSGGPLLNLNGEVIGINTAVSTQAQGIGFAIPTSVINSVLDNLKNNVPIPKPYIGVYMRNLSEAGLQELGLKNGVVIASIIEGSPAEEAQLQPYDVIVEVEGTAIENTKQLAELIAGKNVGDRITMRVWRDGKMLTVGLTIGDQNAN
jgi:S1-C subfamily serine protease